MENISDEAVFSEGYVERRGNNEQGRMASVGGMKKKEGESKVILAIILLFSDGKIPLLRLTI